MTNGDPINIQNGNGTNNGDTHYPPSTSGTVKFIQLDAELLCPHFSPESFDIVWISEALSHLPNKQGFFDNAFKVLRRAHPRLDEPPRSDKMSTDGLIVQEESDVATFPTYPTGRLVIADWFKAPSLAPTQHADDIVPIEKGMLLPPLCTVDEYCKMARQAGFVEVGRWDISENVEQTWSVVSPSSSIPLLPCLFCSPESRSRRVS